MLRWPMHTGPCPKYIPDMHLCSHTWYPTLWPHFYMVYLAWSLSTFFLYLIDGWHRILWTNIWIIFVCGTLCTIMLATVTLAISYCFLQQTLRVQHLSLKRKCACAKDPWAIKALVCSCTIGTWLGLLFAAMPESRHREYGGGRHGKPELEIQ